MDRILSASVDLGHLWLQDLVNFKFLEVSSFLLREQITGISSKLLVTLGLCRV